MMVHMLKQHESVVRALAVSQADVVLTTLDDISKAIKWGTVGMGDEVLSDKCPTLTFAVVWPTEADSIEKISRWTGHSPYTDKLNFPGLLVWSWNNRLAEEVAKELEAL